MCNNKENLMISVVCESGRSACKVIVKGQKSLVPFCYAPFSSDDSMVDSDKLFSVRKWNSSLIDLSKKFVIGEPSYPGAITKFTEGEYFIHTKMLLEIYAAARAVVVEKDASDGKVALALSYTFNNALAVQETAKALKRKWQCTVGGVDASFTVEKVVAAPQAYLSYWRCFTDGSKITDSLGAHPGIVVDIGEYTCDFAYVAKGILQKDKSSSLNSGSRSIWNLVRERLMKTYKVDISVEMLQTEEDCVFSGGIVRRKEIHKLYAQCAAGAFERAILPHFYQTAAADPVFWLLVVGGASATFAPMFKNTLNKVRVVAPNDSRFANAEGLWTLLGEKPFWE